MDGNVFGGALAIFLICLAIVVAVLWIFLPFAVFGTKDLLREILAELKRANDARDEAAGARPTARRLLGASRAGSDAGILNLDVVDIEVHGEAQLNSDGTSRQDIIARCREGEYIELVAEPDNPADPEAVKVCRKNGEQIGYLPRGSGFFHAAKAGTVTGYIGKIVGGEPGKPNRGIILTLRLR
jgi:hypothetical protein